MGRVWPQETRPSATSVNGLCHEASPEEFDPSCPAFPGMDTDQSANYDFLLVFYGNSGPILYRFRDKGQYLPKKISHRHVFHAPLRVLLGIL